MLKGKKIKKVLMFLLMFFTCVIFVFPVVWIFLSTLKSNSELFSYPLTLLPKQPTLEHYKSVLNGEFLVSLKNSFILSIGGTILTVLFTSMSGYVLAIYRNDYKWINWIFILFLAGMMIPGETILTSQFEMINRLGLYNKYLGAILPALTSATSIFMYRQFFMSIPTSLVESARIDGASELRIFTQVIFPLAKTITLIVVIFSFMWRWNDYILPLLVFSSPDKYPVQIVISNMVGSTNINWGPLLSASMLSIIPILLIFMSLQKYILDGVINSGMKN